VYAQDEVTENQRQLITANWGKLNLSRQGVERAKQTMVAALTAASQGPNMYHLSDRTASTSLAAEQVKAALEVSPAISFLTVNTAWDSLPACCCCEPRRGHFIACQCIHAWGFALRSCYTSFAYSKCAKCFSAHCAQWLEALIPIMHAACARSMSLFLCAHLRCVL